MEVTINYNGQAVAVEVTVEVYEALEAAGRPERIDHRSYKRQGVEKIPTIHMGVAAAQMERRGIQTEKGNINRQVAADNKLLKEIKARITRLYNWSKEEAAKPQGKSSVMAQLWQAQQDMNHSAAHSNYGKVKALKQSAALFNFLNSNGITSMQQLHEKISAMNSAYYELRGQIVSGERRRKMLDEHLKMWEQYEKHKGIRRQLDMEHKLLTASATVDSKKVNMVEDNGSKNAEAPLTVVNTRGFDLPKTGDHGTLAFTVVGILLMTGAASALCIAARKKSA